MEEESEVIGIYLHRCDLQNSKYNFRRPTITANLLDRRKGQLVEKKNNSDSEGPTFVEPASLKCRNGAENRCASPYWNEILVLDENISKLISDEQVILMFDLFDDVQTFKNKKTERIRFAWAFLIPRGSDGSLHINKELVLQLYKPRKSCKISHHTCNIFHLYEDHRRKKLNGVLYVTIKGIVRNKSGTAPNKTQISQSAPEQNGAILGESTKDCNPNNLKITKWSRLPTQSCKIPNSVHKVFNIGRKGGSFVRFSRTGNYFAVSSFARIFIYNVVTGDEFCDFNGHNGLIYELDWSPDDKYILSVSGDCTGAIWSLSSKTLDFILPHPSFVYCGKWLGSSEALVTGGKDHMIRYWRKEGESFELKEELGGHHGFVTALAVQGSSLLFSGDSNGILAVQKFNESSNWTCIKRLTFDEISHKVIDSIHPHLGHRRILLTLRGKGSVMVDVVAGVILQTYKAMVNICARSVSCLTPCGSLLFSFCQNGDLNVWEVNTGKLLAVYENLFPVDRLNELGSCVHYHPFEHMIAFTVLGHCYPVYLLKYEQSPKTGDLKLHLTIKSHDDKTSTAGNNTTQLNDSVISLSTIKPDKLSLLVQKMDQVFTVKNDTQIDWSY